jgi:antitoxin YefM
LRRVASGKAKSAWQGRLAWPPILAILLAMAISDQVPLGEFKNRLSELVDRIEHEHGRVVITKHGRPAAVMLSVDDLESLEETLEIMSNPQLLADIREARDEIARGELKPMSKDEMLELIRRKR